VAQFRGRGVRAQLDHLARAQLAPLRTSAGRWVAIALGAFALATVVGLLLLWPSGVEHRRSSVIVASRDVIPATVKAVALAQCPLEARRGCQLVSFRLDGGLHPGRSSYLYRPGDEATPRLSPSDRIEVTPNAQALGNVPAEALAGADPSQAPYGFVDFQRRQPLIVLALVLAAFVVLLGRRVGILSLLGVVAGLFLITRFVVPAILEGSSPFVVALVGSFAAMYVTIVPLYGIGAKSLAALLGTAVSLAAIALLALIAVHAAHISGTAGEDATLVQSLSNGRISLQGLVLAGMLIGALGVLNDVTISQASTVLALRRGAPGEGARALYRQAIGVGRDHLGATVNTLVFAYAGATLPLLLLFTTGDVSFGDAINRETVATEIVAALVGSIGLIAAVPLTTGAAALLASHLPEETLPDEAHAHAHQPRENESHSQYNPALW
jgi:uncharacterized membrane protein